LCRLVLRKDRVRRIACGVWQPHLRISLVCRSKGVEQTFAPPASACLCVPLLKTSMSAIWEGKRKNCVVCINQNQNLPQRWIISQVPPAAVSYCQSGESPCGLNKPGGLPLPQEGVRSAPVSAMNLPPPIRRTKFLATLDPLVENGSLMNSTLIYIILIWTEAWVSSEGCCWIIVWQRMWGGVCVK